MRRRMLATAVAAPCGAFPAAAGPRPAPLAGGLATAAAVASHAPPPYPPAYGPPTTVNNCYYN